MNDATQDELIQDLKLVYLFLKSGRPDEKSRTPERHRTGLKNRNGKPAKVKI